MKNERTKERTYRRSRTLNNEYHLLAVKNHDDGKVCAPAIHFVREHVAGHIVDVTSGVGVTIEPRRRSRAEAGTFFSIGRDFVIDDDGKGEWEMMECHAMSILSYLIYKCKRR